MDSPAYTTCQIDESVINTYYNHKDLKLQVTAINVYKPTTTTHRETNAHEEESSRGLGFSRIKFFNDEIKNKQ